MVIIVVHISQYKSTHKFLTKIIVFLVLFSESVGTEIKKHKGLIDNNFKKFWLSEHAKRINDYKQLCILQIFEIYESLNTPHGYKLVKSLYKNIYTFFQFMKTFKLIINFQIIEDYLFEYKYKANENNLYKEWPGLAKEIVKIAKSKRHACVKQILNKFSVPGYNGSKFNVLKVYKVFFHLLLINM